MDSQIIAALVGLFGLLLTAIFSSAGYFYRSRTESKKSVRKVLYLLLEIRYALQVSLLDPSEEAEKYLVYYMGRWHKRGVPLKREDVDPGVKLLLQEHINNVINATKTDVQDRLLRPFEDALSSLSEISPVLAYRLRGKEKMEALANLSSSYAVEVKDSVLNDVSNDLAKRLMTDALDEAREAVLQKLSRHMDRDVLLLAWNCGILDFLRTKVALSKKQGLDEEALSELGLLIDGFISKVFDAVKNESIENSGSA